MPHARPKNGEKRIDRWFFAPSNSIHFVLNLARNAPLRIYDPVEGPTPAWNHLSRRKRAAGRETSANWIAGGNTGGTSQRITHLLSPSSSRNRVSSSVSPWFIRATTVKENAQRSLPLPTLLLSVLRVSGCSYRADSDGVPAKNVEFPAIVSFAARVDRD